MVEAEFHAIWRSPSGDLKDITKRTDSEKTILFLKEHQRKYDYSIPEYSVENIRRPVVESPIIYEMIQLTEKKNQLEKIYHQGDLIRVPERIYLPIIHRLAEILNMIERSLHLRNVGRNNSCPCGSGKKFKKCCGG